MNIRGEGEYEAYNIGFYIVLVDYVFQVMKTFLSLNLHFLFFLMVLCILNYYYSLIVSLNTHKI